MATLEWGRWHAHEVADRGHPHPTVEDFARELGLNLQRARLARGLSQEGVAAAAGISAYTYQKFEKGESKPGQPMNPRLYTLVALSQVLEVAIVDLIPARLPDLAANR